MGLQTKKEPIFVEQTYPASVGKVWKALTESSQMRQWFFENINSFAPEIGFETQFDVISNGKNYRHIWKVVEVEENEKLAYTWRYGGYPGNSKVIWRLRTEDDRTHLKLNHEDTESFPQDNPDFSRESCTAGWKYFICERLKEFLNEKNRRRKT